MPRIPTRTTPYDTPTHQHRHFKNKRDQILRALGRSSYINGSQFAIVWISARGEAETYASPVLQSLLYPKPGQTSLFGPEILERAKDAALKAPSELRSSKVCLEHIKKPKLPRSIDQGGSEGLLASCPLTPACSKRESHESRVQEASSAKGVKHLSNERLSQPVNGRSPPGNYESVLSSPTSSHSDAAFSPVDHVFNSISEAINAASIQPAEAQIHNNTKRRLGHESSLPVNLQSVNVPNHEDSQSMFPTDPSVANPFRPHEKPVQDPRNADYRNQTRAFKSLPRRSSPQNDSANVVHFPNPRSLCQFLESKFCQLQQNTCKLVCKAWIKAVEPKKQTKFPYRNGDAHKPEWWPEKVTHREPDHLLKHDRMKLMLAVLSAGKVTVDRLEMASAEKAAFIPADKMDILRDIYKVAKEEERLRVNTWQGVKFPLSVELCRKACELPPTSPESTFFNGPQVDNLFPETKDNAPKPTEEAGNLSGTKDNLTFGLEEENFRVLETSTTTRMRNASDSWQLSQPFQMETTRAMNAEGAKTASDLSAADANNSASHWSVYPDANKEAPREAITSKITGSSLTENPPPLPHSTTSQYSLPSSVSAMYSSKTSYSSVNLDPTRKFIPDPRTLEQFFPQTSTSEADSGWRASESLPSNNMPRYYDPRSWPDLGISPYLGTSEISASHPGAVNENTLNATNQDTIHHIQQTHYSPFASESPTFGTPRISSALLGFDSKLLASQVDSNSYTAHDQLEPPPDEHNFAHSTCLTSNENLPSYLSNGIQCKDSGEQEENPKSVLPLVAVGSVRSHRSTVWENTPFPG